MRLSTLLRAHTPRRRAPARVRWARVAPRAKLRPAPSRVSPRCRFPTHSRVLIVAPPPPPPPQPHFVTSAAPAAAAAACHARPDPFPA